MPPITDLASTAAAWLATYWLHSTLLLGGAWLAGRRLGHRRLAVQESIWKAALAGGLITATLQLGLGWQPLAGGWTLPVAPPEAAAAEAAAGTTSEAAAPAPVARPRPAVRVIETPAPVSGAAAAASIALPAMAPSAAGDPADPDGRPATAAAAGTGAPAVRSRTLPAWAIPAAVALWLAGALLLIARLALSHLRLGRSLRGREPIGDGPLATLLAGLRAAAGIRRPIALSKSPALPVPIARGVARGEICLPQRALDELGAGEQEGMVAHELAHLARRDPAWLLAARALECAFFLQPLHRIARRRLREIAEYRCDDWAAAATGRPLSLARCLTEVAGWSLGGFRPLPAPSMAAGGSALGRRVRRLLDRPEGDEGRPRWLPLAAAAGLVAVAAVAPGFTGASPADQGSQEPDQDAEAIERAIEEDFARQQAEREREADPDPDVEVEVDEDIDVDVDVDVDVDEDIEADEAEDRADDAEDAVEEAFEAEMELFEEELEAALEPLEEDLDRELDDIDEQLERDMEVFEEELERQFEAMEDDLEVIAETMALQGLSGQGDDELHAVMADLAVRLGEQFGSYGESFGAIGAEIGELMEERFGDDFGRRIEELTRLAMPDPELIARVEPELERLQAEARRLAERDELTDAEAERLAARARELAVELRPSQEELDRLRASARELAERVRPTREELGRLAEAQRAAAERWRVEHRDELERLRSDLARERERIHAEAERLRREAGSLEELSERREREAERIREEHERQREEERARAREQREEERRERERQRQQQEGDGG